MGQRYTKQFINSYADAVDFMSRARNVEKGRPFRNWGRIRYGAGESITIENAWHSATICTLYPNNVIEFNLDNDGGISSMATTLVGSFEYAMPFRFIRVKTNKYRVGHSSDNAGYLNRVKGITQEKNDAIEKKRAEMIANGADHWELPYTTTEQWEAWRLFKREGQEYFNGVQFDMHTGKCLNPRPDREAMIDEEKKKTWSKAIRKFRRGIRIRVKTKVFEQFNDDAVKRQQHINSLDWSDRHKELIDLRNKDNVNFITECIKENKFPSKLLSLLMNAVYDNDWYLRDRLPDNEIGKKLDTRLDSLSFLLRENWGVFTGEWNVG